MFVFHMWFLQIFTLLVDRSNVEFAIMYYINFLVCAYLLADFDFFNSNEYVLIIIIAKTQPGVKLQFRSAY